MKRRVVLPMLLIVIGAGCSLPEADEGLNFFSDVSDFGKSLSGWTGDFAYYPAGETDSIEYELKCSYTMLPSEVGTGKKAIMMSGNNKGGGLFMFMTKKVTGLQANMDYTLVFDVEFASNAPTGAFGTGGAPGESVLLKAGASETQPKKVIDGEDYVLNIDKGGQLTDGEDMMVLGDIGVAPNTSQFTLITRSNANSNSAFLARSNSKGELWLVIGADSRFTGVTTLYYTRINVVFSSYY